MKGECCWFRLSASRSLSEMERFEPRLKGQEEACVFGDLVGEQLRQREQQVQRPWSGAEPQVPDDQTLGRVAGRREQALGPVPCASAYVKVSTEVEETWGGGVSPPAGSPRRVGTCLLVSGCVASTRNSHGHSGLWIVVELMNNQSLKSNLAPLVGMLRFGSLLSELSTLALALDITRSVTLLTQPLKFLFQVGCI